MKRPDEVALFIEDVRELENRSLEEDFTRHVVTYEQDAIEVRDYILALEQSLSALDVAVRVEDAAELLNSALCGCTDRHRLRHGQDHGASARGGRPARGDSDRLCGRGNRHNQGTLSRGLAMGARLHILPYLPKRINHLLDMGSGDGAFARAVQHRYACVTTTIDPLNPEADHTDRIEHLLYRGKLKQYDVITCLDVLEHLEAPAFVLYRLYKHLEPGGHLIASIPNVQHWSVVWGLLRGRWEYTDEGILDRTHRWFFTRQGIRRMFGYTGYRIETLEPLAQPYTGRFPVAMAVLRGCRQALLRDFAAFQYVVVAKGANHELVRRGQVAD